MFIHIQDILVNFWRKGTGHSFIEFSLNSKMAVQSYYHTVNVQAIPCKYANLYFTMFKLTWNIAVYSELM